MDTDEKVVLIPPPSRASILRPSLGLMCLASYMESKDIPTDILDIKSNAPEEEVVKATLEKIKSINPDIVGITCTTSEVNEVISLSEEIKKGMDGDITITVGGMHPTLIPEDMIYKDSPIDYAVIGEGEETFKELVETLRKNEKPSKVKGIAKFNENEVKRTPPRPHLMDLDKLPMPAFDKVPMDFYTKPNLYVIRGVLLSGFFICTIRGCPFRCKFCANKKMFGRSPRYRSPKLVVDEIELLKEKFKIDGLYIYDDTFSASKKHVLGICEELKKRKIDILWGCETRVHLVTEELLREMKKAGCIQIDFGVESGSQEVLDRMRKDITVPQIKNAFRLCKKAGIRQFANLMINTPGETEEDLQKTMDITKEINPNVSIFNITAPYPGTGLFDDIRRMPKKDYDMLIQTSPEKYIEFTRMIDSKYRLAEHDIPMEELVQTISKEFPNIHKLSFGNVGHLKRFMNNISFFVSPQYLRIMMKSDKKKEYLQWFTKLGAMIQSQKM